MLYGRPLLEAPGGERMKKFWRLISACALMLGFISCSAFNSESGSVAILLPNSTSARSISSSGSITENGQIEAYEIRVRNSYNEMSQKISGVTPGSTIVIDDLYPDTYTISVLAYQSTSGDDGYINNPTSFTYDSVSYYGRTTVTVYAGEEKEASIIMKPFDDSGSYPVVTIYPPEGENFFTSGSFDYSCTVTGNGVNFTYTGEETGESGKTYGTMNCSYLNGIANYYWNQKKETFLEPGFTYTFNVTVTVTKSGESVTTYRGSKTQVVEQSNSGNQFSHTIDIYVK